MNTAECDEVECVGIVCIEKSIGLVLKTFAVAVYISRPCRVESQRSFHTFLRYLDKFYKTVD